MSTTGQLTTTPTEYKHVVLDERGAARIAGSRSRVSHIVMDRLVGGLTPEEIHASYPHLSLAQIYSALAYYFDHREEIDARMTEDRTFAAALRARTPSKRDQKLRSLRGEA